MKQDDLASHYESRFSSVEGELYAPLAGMDLVAHERRMELLASIDLPPLLGLTVVDYGVGSWGFGCIFPRLKECSDPIGVDVSPSAIRRSEEFSRVDEELAGKEVRYLTSFGYDIALDDGSVDVFFCGECIEHIEDTDAFLTEVHRIVRPGGMVIFTTPNASPYIYRALGLRWCSGFEHVALMDLAELRSYLSRFFNIVREYGFNQTVFPGLDSHIPPELARSWVRFGTADPENATSLIVVGTRGMEPIKPPQKVIQLPWTELELLGQARALELVAGVNGGSLAEGARFEVMVPEGANRCHLIFWSHSWSGIALVSIGEVEHQLNLYSHVGGCLRASFTALTPGQKITIRRAMEKDFRSEYTEVIVYRAVFAGDRLSSSV